MTILLAVIIGGAVIVLAVPIAVDLEFTVAGAPASGGSIRTRVHWLFFAWTGEAPRVPGPTPARRARSRRRSWRRLPSHRLLAAITTRGFLARTVRLVSQLAHALAPQMVEGWVRFGFEDPTSTGILFGAAHAVAGVARATGWKLRLEPEFSGPAWAGHARVVWAVRPGAVLWPVWTFLVSRSTWRAAFAAIRAQ